MHEVISSYIQKFLKDHAKRKKLISIFAVLSLLVASGVIWKMRLTGISMNADVQCGIEEHLHEESCYEMVLICGLTESEPTQTEEKLQETEDSTQEEAEEAEETEETEETGEAEESQKPHVHTEACYEKRLICGKEEHTHTISCMCDTSADRETPADWEATLPELKHEWREDFLAVANSQLGYKESSRNFVLEDDGEHTRGYTRYGEWYGNAYGHWCAMFVSWCLNYAEIPEEVIPYAAGCHAWTVELEKLGLFQQEKEYLPNAGDIIFFDTDGDGQSEHVGIVTELEEEANDKRVLHTIEGNAADMVSEHTYEESEESILGYVSFEKAVERYEQLHAEAEETRMTDTEMLSEDILAEAVPVTADTAEKLKAAFTDAADNDVIQLEADFEIAGTITLEDKSVILDLNGHKLTVTGTESLFYISSGSLTIMDSQESAVTTAPADGETYGRLGTYVPDGTLTYYITESQVTNPGTGATRETLVRYEVQPCGRIQAGGAVAVTISGGSFHLESGMLGEGTNRAIYMTGGSVNLNGGYICGFTKEDNGLNDNGNEKVFGGAVWIQGGSFVVDGGVLAANRAPNGGAIYAKSGSIEIKNGVISGNVSDRIRENWDFHSEQAVFRCGGGGIYANGNAKIQMSGGYITNNEALDAGYFDGGGGVCLSGASNMELSGGFVTGNKAQGGGGIRTDFGKGTTFTMKGGFLSGNIATHAEGAGAAMDNGSWATIEQGYITNNRILNTGHWGGGGLFCAANSDLYLKNVLITSNDAGGFGGGIAGCPTGKIYLYIDDGCAVYENKDLVHGEPHFATDGVKQDVDQEICDNFFRAHGHKDYFCALNSTVTGKMLGGFAANWEGTADHTIVNLGPEDAQTATRVMGLASHPSADAIKSAQDTAKIVGGVYINGNYSYTHGGGILCNGNLIVGKPTNIEVPARLGIRAEKVLLDSTNNEIADLTDYHFKFQLLSSKQKIIYEAESDADGTIIFETLEFNQAGTYEYTVKEIPDDSKSGIIYDTAEYQITVTVEEDSAPLQDNVIKKVYLIKHITVKKSDGKGGWTKVSDKHYNDGKDTLSLPLTKDKTFVNKTEEISRITVVKRWAEGSDSTPVTVDLLESGHVISTVVLSGENQWTYTWEQLQPNHKYEVKERELPGYTAGYSEPSYTQAERAAFWVPASSLEEGKQYMIVNAAGDQALYITEEHQNHGFDTTDKKGVTQQKGTLTIGNVEYESWYEAEHIDDRCIFTAQSVRKNNNEGLILKNKGTSKDTWLLVQNADNNVLKSTSGDGYASIMSVKDGVLKGQYNYDWNPNDLRTVIYSNNKFNTASGTENAAKLYTLISKNTLGNCTIIITNTPKEAYELPETGGPGSDIFTIAGVLLMVLSLLAGYKLRGNKRGIL